MMLEPDEEPQDFDANKDQDEIAERRLVPVHGQENIHIIDPTIAQARSLCNFPTPQLLPERSSCVLHRHENCFVRLHVHCRGALYAQVVGQRHEMDQSQV